jgi:pyocin large subunit-like protein
VDLYDTRTNQDIVIREELVKENMAWPKYLSPEKEAKMFAKNKVLG